MSVINSNELLALARKGYCVHQLAALTGVKLETVRGVLRAANQEGEYDAALHLSPTKREPVEPQMKSMDFSSLETLVLGSMLHEMAASRKRSPEQKAFDFTHLYAGSPVKEQAKPVKPKMSPSEYLEVSKQVAAALAAKKILEKAKEKVDSINPITHVQHLEDEDLMYLLQVALNELQKRFYGKDQSAGE